LEAVGFPGHNGPMEAFENLLLSHWPFFTVMGAFWLVGHFSERSVFTRERAAQGAFWRWGRESLELHPLAAGLLVGLAWQDPEGRDWGLAASMGYFVGAGIGSLVFWWALTKIVLPRFGIDASDLRLPGESNPPGPPPPEPPGPPSEPPC
jgi:hypothetical protein